MCLEECERELDCQSVVYDHYYYVCHMLPSSPVNFDNIKPSEYHDYYYLCAFDKLGKPGK